YKDESLLYILKNDNTLWITNLKADNSTLSMEESKIKKYNNPVKILDGVKEVEIRSFNTFTIMENGDLLGWYNSFDGQLQDNVSNYKFDIKTIMEGIDSFDKKTMTLDIIKKDRSHWSLIAGDLQRDSAKDSLVSEILKNASEDFSDIDNIKAYDENYFLTADGEYWIRGFGSNSIYDNSLKSIPFVKVADNVLYAEDISKEGLYICKDNSLWIYGIMNQYNGSYSYDFDHIKPVKIMENVKEAHMQDNTFAALLNDSSLYVWGSNLNGIVTGHSEGYVSKPQYIFGDISNFYFGAKDFFALKNNGTLMNWGNTAFNISSHDRYTKNPISLVEYQDDKINHYKYESVGIDEDIDILVEIKDIDYSDSVKFVVDGGKEIILEKSSGDYFTGIIPGLPKEGMLNYQIKASNKDGITISSPIYSTQVISNDACMIDSENAEVISKDMKIFVNGEEILSDILPVIKSGRTLLQLRSLAEALGAKVSWNEYSKEIWITKGNITAVLKLGSREIICNGKKVKIDVPAVTINNRTMLPARVICDLLGATISWDQQTNRVEIFS
ncbi:MAG: stalk domain-containing protein, partial [Bacillota bacterium]|nr:stalk domain-containing protein [Bacillota bacterium]